tara:strand:- start:43 stop:387 length:345 start_codon:yes stop_codon:yes gene_type:complete
VGKIKTSYKTGDYIMSITSEKLKNLIKEELDRVLEADTLGTGKGRQAARDQSLEVGRTAISGIERAVIVKLQRQLLDAAKVSNIATGPVATLVKRLSAALAKLGISGEDTPEAS